MQSKPHQLAWWSSWHIKAVTHRCPHACRRSFNNVYLNIFEVGRENLSHYWERGHSIEMLAPFAAHIWYHRCYKVSGHFHSDDKLPNWILSRHENYINIFVFSVCTPASKLGNVKFLSIKTFHAKNTKWLYDQLRVARNQFSRCAITTKSDM